MYLIPADRMQSYLFMSRESTVVSKRKHRETVKKRDPFAEAKKIRKHHPYEECPYMRKKMNGADLRKMTVTNTFAEFLSKVMPRRQASKVAPPPLSLPPTPQKMLRGTQTTVTSASFTGNPPPIKEFTHEQERVEEDDDDDEDDYDEDDNFVENEVREYGRENISPVASPYLMPYVYEGRILDTQYGIRKDGDMFIIGDSPIVVDTSGDITIKNRVFKGSKGLWELLKRKKVNTEYITKHDL